MGKHYGVRTLSDLSQPQTLLLQLCHTFPTFQLMYSPNLVSVPLNLPVGDLVRRTSHVVFPRADSDKAVTYADAMLKLIRKSLRRKLSVVSMDSTRTVLRESGSDVEDAGCGTKQRSWKRMFRMLSSRLVNAH